MARSVFFSLTEEGLSAYAVETNRKTSVGEPVTFPRDGGRLDIPEGLKGMEESWLSLPLGMLNFRVLDLPFSDIRKIRELIPFEIDGLIIGGSGNIVFDVHLLSGSNGKSRVLVTYISKEVLGPVLNRLRISGFDPRVVTSLELSEVLDSSASEKEIMETLLSPTTHAGGAGTGALLREIRSPALNLRMGEFAYTADTEKAGRSLRLTVVLAALLCVVFFSDMAVTIFSLGKQNRSIKDSMRKEYLVLFPAEKKVTDELYQLKAHTKELKDKENSFIGVSPLTFLLDLSGVVRPGTVFTDITLDKELVILKGECPSLSEVQRIKGAVGEFLVDPSISDSRQASQNRIAFTITAKGRKR